MAIGNNNSFATSDLSRLLKNKQNYKLQNYEFNYRGRVGYYSSLFRGELFNFCPSPLKVTVSKISPVKAKK